MRILLLSLTLILSISLLFGGGIVQNTNQSADFLRMMNRNASQDIDAAYFNPAGLTSLPAGMHLYLSNQTIFQTRTITAAFPAYNSNTFVGETFAPVFPNIYFVYNTGKLAVSAGFMPVGGGGSADFPEGLPSFDYLVAKAVGLEASTISPALASYGKITGYAMDAGFVGSSIYLGGQANLAYQLHDMIAVAFGVRYVSAKNTYVGSLENVGWTAEYGDITGVIPNIEVDSERTGTAITPIIGFNLKPMDGLNIGFRYEVASALEMTSATTKDNTGDVIKDANGDPDPMFPDKTVYHADLPANIGVGLGLDFMEKFHLDASFNYYPYTSGIDWDGQEENVDNGMEFGAGLEYSLSEALVLSAGYLNAISGAKDLYQSDLSYSLSSQTIGAGGKYSLSTSKSLSFAVFNTFYEDGQNIFAGTSREEIYSKTATGFAIGYAHSF